MKLKLFFSLFVFVLLLAITNESSAMSFEVDDSPDIEQVIFDFDYNSFPAYSEKEDGEQKQKQTEFIFIASPCQRPRIADRAYWKRYLGIGIKIV